VRRLAVVVVVGFALAGCGGGSGPTTNTAIVNTRAETVQIQNAYHKFFSSQTSVADREAVLQDGAKFRSVIQAFASNPLAKKVSVTVTSLAIHGDHAKVVYTVKLGGLGLPKQTGTAVKENGTWKVGDASLCKLVSLGGSTPSACKS
jgi:hypothetical protein